MARGPRPRKPSKPPIASWYLRFSCTLASPKLGKGTPTITTWGTGEGAHRETPRPIQEHRVYKCMNQGGVGRFWPTGTRYGGKEGVHNRPMATAYGRSRDDNTVSVQEGALRPWECTRISPPSPPRH